MGWHDFWYESATGHLRWWWRVVTFLLVAFLASMILCVFMLMPLMAYFKDPNHIPANIMPLFFALIWLAISLAGIAAGIWALRTFEHLPPYTFGLSLRGPWVRALFTGAGAGLGITVLLCGILVLTGLATLRPQVLTTGEWLLFLLTALNVLLGAIAAVVILHGYLFQTLLRGIGPIASLLIIAALGTLFFTGTQSASLIGPANNLVLVILLGMLYLRSGALWAPLGLAIGWTFGQFFVAQPVSGFSLLASTPLSLTIAKTAWLSDPSFGPAGGLIASALLLAALAAVAYSRRGLPLESHWWEWRQLTSPQQQSFSWDFSVGARYYQWKLLVRDRSDT